jgi:glycosyltransferase involved in cell wall biosynthesis
VADEPDPSDAPIFFGGINVYLQQKSGLFRHTPGWFDRLLNHPSLLRWSCRHAHMTRPEDLGALTLSMLRGRESRQVKELNKMLAWLAGEPAPDLVCLSNALLIGLAGPLRETLGAPVACTLQGEDSFIDRLPPPYDLRVWEEVAAQAVHVDAFLAVSAYYRDVVLARTGAAPERFQVVHNGIDLEGYTPRKALPDPPVIGYLARMCRDKGLPALVEAYIRLRRDPAAPRARLQIAGAQTPGDRPLVAQLRRWLNEAGLESDAAFYPNLDRAQKIGFLQGLSVLSVPATYGECFGLYVLEALACGVPVVQPRHAAFPEVLEATGGGVLCEPDNPQALADALAALLADPARLEGLGRDGREQVLARFSLERMADRILEVYARLAADPASGRRRSV